MKELKKHLRKIADNTNRPLEEILTYHLLEGVLRRVADSNYGDELVLRGGMLTRLWVAPERRTAEDVDFLGLYSFDIEITKEKFKRILENTSFTDEVIFDIDSLEVTGIWLETEYPGARVNVNAAFADYQKNIQIDVGFGDPIVPSPQWIDYPTLTTEESNKYKLQAVTPETMFGWKLHGLVENRMSQWRPKDLYDLMLFTLYVELDETLVKPAIITAFNSRNTTFKDVYYMLSNPQWWDRSKNRSKWKWYIRKKPKQTMPDFLEIVAIVTQKWASTVREIAEATS